MDVKNTHSVTKTEISVFGRQALDDERRRSPSLADKVLRFLGYGMNNAIHYKCEFVCDSNPKRCNTIDIYTLAHTRKRRPQDVTENMYLNDNKCNTLTEDGAIKTIWSGYYSQLLNETKRKGNCRMREILKKKYLRYP